MNALLTGWTFRFGLLRAAYTLETIDRLASRSRLGGGRLVTSAIGFDLRLTKP